MRNDLLVLFSMNGKGEPLALRKTRRPTIRKTVTATKSLESVRWNVENPQPADIETFERTEAFRKLAHSGRSKAFKEDVTGERIDAESMPIHMF